MDNTKLENEVLLLENSINKLHDIYEGIEINGVDFNELWKTIYNVNTKIIATSSTQRELVKDLNETYEDYFDVLATEPDKSIHNQISKNAINEMIFTINLLHRDKFAEKDVFNYIENSNLEKNVFENRLDYLAQRREQVNNKYTKEIKESLNNLYIDATGAIVLFGLGAFGENDLSSGEPTAIYVSAAAISALALYQGSMAATSAIKKNKHYKILNEKIREEQLRQDSKVFVRK